LDWRTGRITRYRKRKSRCHDLPGNIDNLKYRMELWERAFRRLEGKRATGGCGEISGKREPTNLGVVLFQFPSSF
jgi:hypothetical protein